MTELTSLLRDFASQLGVTVSELFAILTERAVIEGWTGLGLHVVSSISLAVLVAFLLKYLLTADIQVEGTDILGRPCMEPSVRAVVAFAVCVIGTFLFIRNVTSIPGDIIQILAPESEAARELLELIPR